MTVALTFDDGPHPVYTPLLLDGLQERGIHATFFLIGSQAEMYPELVQRMAREGHQVGNHTYDHVDLEQLTEWEGKQNLKKSEQILEEILGPGDYWVRPPYGKLKNQGKCISTPIIRWSVDTEDWKNRNKEKILEILYRDISDGGIILMHDRFSESVEAALQAVDELTARGVEFTTVEELFSRKNVTPEKGTVYRMVTE